MVKEIDYGISKKIDRDGKRTIYQMDISYVNDDDIFKNSIKSLNLIVSSRSEGDKIRNWIEFCMNDDYDLEVSPFDFKSFLPSNYEEGKPLSLEENFHVLKTFVLSFLEYGINNSYEEPLKQYIEGLEVKNQILENDGIRVNILRALDSQDPYAIKEWAISLLENYYIQYPRKFKEYFRFDWDYTIFIDAIVHGELSDDLLRQLARDENRDIRKLMYYRWDNDNLSPEIFRILHEPEKGRTRIRN